MVTSILVPLALLSQLNYTANPPANLQRTQLLIRTHLLVFQKYPKAPDEIARLRDMSDSWPFTDFHCLYLSPTLEPPPPQRKSLPEPTTADVLLSSHQHLDCDPPKGELMKKKKKKSKSGKFKCSQRAWLTQEKSSQRPLFLPYQHMDHWAFLPLFVVLSCIRAWRQGV